MCKPLVSELCAMETSCLVIMMMIMTTATRMATTTTKIKCYSEKSHKKHISSSFEKRENKDVSRRQFSCFRKSREHSCNAAVQVPRTECIYLRHKFCGPCCGIICQGRSFRNVQPLDSSSTDPRIQGSKDRGGRTESRTDKSPITGRSYD